jgi:hypothetical protein
VEYGAPRPLERLNRALSWTFRLGRFFGSEVRVYGTVGIVWLFLDLRGLEVRRRGFLRR